MPHTILIVDDSPVIRGLVRAFIEQSSDWIVCAEAGNGEIAIQKVREFNPDAVLLDFQMPVMNGIDAARQISVIAPHTAMVMFTMHFSEQLRTMAHTAGIKEIFSKSERVGDLILASLTRIGAGLEKHS